jgi:hypothetical protein
MYNMHNRGGCGAAVRNRASERRHSQRVHTWDVVPGCCAVVNAKRGTRTSRSVKGTPKKVTRKRQARARAGCTVADAHQMCVACDDYCGEWEHDMGCVAQRSEAKVTHSQKKKNGQWQKVCGWGVVGGCDQGVTEGRNDRG